MLTREDTKTTAKWKLITTNSKCLEIMKKLKIIQLINKTIKIINKKLFKMCKLRIK